MKNGWFVVSLLSLGAIIGTISYVTRDDLTNQEKYARSQEERHLSLQEASRTNELEALALKEFWTGRLSGDSGERTRLPIYPTAGLPDDKAEYIAGVSQPIVVPEGTRFRVVRWSNVRSNASKLFVKFEHGQEGWLYSGFLANGGTALLDQPYNNQKGLDTSSKQQFYDVPYSEALLIQKRANEEQLAEAQTRRESLETAKRQEALLAAERAAQSAKEAALEAKAAKKRGVVIGMSKAQVIASNWGKPRKVNKTTNAYGTREQWVYDGGYLYFQDGALATIQN